MVTEFPCLVFYNVKQLLAIYFIQPSEKDLNNRHGFEEEHSDKATVLARRVYFKAMFGIFPNPLPSLISWYPTFAHLKLFSTQPFYFRS